MILDRELFNEMMEFIKERSKAGDAINEVLDKEDLSCFSNIYDKYEIKVIEWLERIMNDTENSWISYWVYSLDFGNSWREGTVTENGQDIPLKTSDDLYNLLVQNILSKNKRKAVDIKKISKIIEEELPHFIMPRKDYYNGLDGVDEEQLKVCAIRIIDKVAPGLVEKRSKKNVAKY